MVYSQDPHMHQAQGPGPQFNQRQLMDLLRQSPAFQGLRNQAMNGANRALGGLLGQVPGEAKIANVQQTMLNIARMVLKQLKMDPKKVEGFLEQLIGGLENILQVQKPKERPATV